MSAKSIVLFSIRRTQAQLCISLDSVTDDQDIVIAPGMMQIDVLLHYSTQGLHESQMPHL